jgi:hypothetical protein
MLIFVAKVNKKIIPTKYFYKKNANYFGVMKKCCTFALT